jgi:hypothetical protein
MLGMAVSAIVFVFVFGLLVFLAGVLTVGAAGATADGAMAIVIGAAIMIACVLERPRYRPDGAEMVNPIPGPGGGESGYLEPRFAPTTEAFIDPTSRRRMRVFLDPRTGERRYRAED